MRLYDRLSYEEIGKRLHISPEMAFHYGRLGVVYYMFARYRANGNSWYRTSA
jgi:hypothetical protein